MNRSSGSPYKTAYIRRRARESIFRGRGIVLTDGGGNRKVAQGNIIALLDNAGGVVVQYVYDAWGNHAVLDENGNDLTDSSHIGNRNPFRYRGYFYDEETGLYYLQTRYYDPEIGRFLNMDDVSYADPEQFHGLNLYAYCGNDPVNNIDPTGHFAITLSLLAALGVAAAVGAGIGVVGTFFGDVVNAALTGKWSWSSWETYLGNAIGGAIGGAISLIPWAGAFLGSVTGGTLGTVIEMSLEKATGRHDWAWSEIGLQFTVSLGINLVAAGFTSYLRIPGITKGSHSWQQVFKSGFTKTWRYGFRMSLKTLAKGAGYLMVSSFSTGFVVGNLMQSFSDWLIGQVNW